MVKKKHIQHYLFLVPLIDYTISIWVMGFIYDSQHPHPT